MAERDEISVHLPRALVGGLRKGPVEDLLRRIAHDYEQLELENKKLWATLEQFGEAGAGEAGPAAEAGDGSPAQLGSADQRVSPIQPVSPAQPEWPNEKWWPDPLGTPDKLSGGDASAQPEGEETDLAEAVLMIAQRTANELRESARAECELMIKKARAHLEKLERESEHDRAATAAELAQLQAIKAELRDHMRGSLRALLRTFVAERSGGGQLSAEWREPLAFLDTLDPGRSGKKKKKHKP